MCGIFGASGNPVGAAATLDGLRRLEYRGYDSWGLAWKNRDNIGFIKKTGKIGESKVPNIESNVIMGHTRWATHGTVSAKNAHPLFSREKNVAVVHNGIVENFLELKHELEQKGIRFESQTDTEVIPHLIARYLERHAPLEAIQKTAKRLKGSLAFCAILKNGGGLYCFKRQAPLVVGKGDSAFFVSSDSSAFPSSVRQILFLRDNQLAVLDKGIRLVDRSGKPKTPEWKKRLLPESAGLRGFRHFMLKEIFEQPNTVQKALETKIAIPFGELQKTGAVIFVACGTSWHAGLIGSSVIEQWAKISAKSEYASEFRYRKPFLSPNTLVIALSQSGETADVLAAVEKAKSQNCRILAICNKTDSSIARASDWVIDLQAGPEIGVASTKTFSSQIVVLLRLALLLALAKKQRVPGQIGRELKKIPAKIRSVLRKRASIRKMAKKLCGFQHAIFLGRDKNYPVSLEGALKLKEVSYIHAEGMPAAEMKHGPIALIDRNMPVVAIAVHDELYPKVFSNLQEIRARRGKLFVITDRATKELRQITQGIIEIPSTLPELFPLLTVVSVQLLAYEAAVFKKLDVDKPRNLAKSVTVE